MYNLFIGWFINTVIIFTDRPKLAPTSFRSCFSPPPKPADEGTEMKTKEDENKPATPQRKPPSKVRFELVQEFSKINIALVMR